MASYFELPPQQKAGAENIEAMPEEQRKHLGRMNVLSPAVTQLLDDLGQEDSDSDSEEGTQSETEDTKHVDKLTKRKDSTGLDTTKHTKSTLSPEKSERSPTKGSAEHRLTPTRSGGGGSSKPRQPHMARFHSLRSMLFSSTIEGKMKTMTQEDCAREEEAANKWKSQHSQRQMPNRPKTPEKDAQGKAHGIGSRLKTSLRRITTKEVPTMATLNEDGGAHDFSDHGSTASSDNEPEPYQWKPREADEESIDHSDVEELVRWVSRRDPPSDGEARADKAPNITLTKADSGHDSIGDSDVDDLVRWASRKSKSPGPEDTRQDLHSGYSDASTESDSELITSHDSSEDEDPDDLVRWISHRDGPTAGPVRQSSNSPIPQKRHDSDVPELSSWTTRKDANLTPPKPDAEEPERGRPLSREGPARPKPKGHITHDDINDLVKWVSRKDSKQSPPEHEEIDPLRRDSEIDPLQRVEDAKKQQLGMSVDEGSLSHSDVKELIEHVRSSSLGDDTPKLGEPERGDLKQFRTSERGVQADAAQEHLNKSRGGNMQEKGESEHRGSLGDGDVDELVKWVSRKS
jgi:hypothetical protein